MSETEKNTHNQEPKTSRLVIVFAMLAVFGILGCWLMPQFEREQAKNEIPTMREYALNQIADLTEQERTMIIETEPVIGHANYAIYYFWWKDGEGNNILCVESLPPSNGLEPTRAYRCKDK